MKYTAISTLIIGIIQVNVYATVPKNQTNTLQAIADNLVLDSSFAIEWTKDANAVKTMCEANHPLWQSFNPAGVAHNSGRNLGEICAQDGLMNWYEANAWISHLNSNSYLGRNDWRLPGVDLSDPTCSVQLGVPDSQLSASFGQDCANSELGHLYQTAFYNTTENNRYFSNLSGTTYWSNTELPLNQSLVGTFDLQEGWQDAVEKSSDLLHVWPVHAL
jgi:hypothetical protein